MSTLLAAERTASSATLTLRPSSRLTWSRGCQGVRVRSVAAGYFTSLAATTDGEAFGWGLGVDHAGEPDHVLGLELLKDQLVPRKYPGLQLHV